MWPKITMMIVHVNEIMNKTKEQEHIFILNKSMVIFDIHQIRCDATQTK